jgi:hypothetical protein
MLRRAAAAMTTLLAVLVVTTTASAYSVVVRWSDEADREVAGYRLYVHPEGGDERAPVDVPRPRRDASGGFETTIGDLIVETTYTFALSAYYADGSESERSNAHTLGYAEAAWVVDSDHDGLTDAAEDRDLDQSVDGGETDRTRADSDGDDVLDGLELTMGTDPLDPTSPSCAPLAFSAFGRVGSGTYLVGYDADLDRTVLAMTPRMSLPTAIGAIYPPRGRGDLAAGMVVSRIRTNDRFRIDVNARSTAGQVYRLRLEGHGTIDRTSRRRIRRSLGDHFTGDRYESIGFDVASEMARMDPTAVFSHIERLTVRGNLVMQEPTVCR